MQGGRGRCPFIKFKKKRERKGKVKNNCSSCRDPGGPGPSEALTSESRGRRETSRGSSSRAAGSRPGNARACGFNLAAAQKPSSTGAPPAPVCAAPGPAGAAASRPHRAEMRRRAARPGARGCWGPPRVPGERDPETAGPARARQTGSTRPQRRRGRSCLFLGDGHLPSGTRRLLQPFCPH